MIQRGAGTSTNMNTNEVIANRGLEILWHAKGKYKFLHPNDNVNTLSQSTNDTYPTADKLAIVMGPERGPEEHGSTQERARSEGRRVQGLGIVFYGGWHQRCRDCQLFHCRLCVNNLGHCRSCRFPTLGGMGEPRPWRLVIGVAVGPGFQHRYCSHVECGAYRRTYRRECQLGSGQRARWKVIS